MNKQEFVDKLRIALNGKIPPAKVEETVNYYQDYINTEIRKGKREEEVLSMLGDPRLIARTIVQTSGMSGSGTGYDYESGGSESVRYANQGSQQGVPGGSWIFRMPRWLLILLVVVVVVLVMGIVFSLLSFLAPVIITVAAVLFLVKLFRDWLN